MAGKYGGGGGNRNGQAAPNEKTKRENVSQNNRQFTYEKSAKDEIEHDAGLQLLITFSEPFDAKKNAPKQRF
jgi:hypothetical protein